MHHPEQMASATAVTGGPPGSIEPVAVVDDPPVWHVEARRSPVWD